MFFMEKKHGGGERIILSYPLLVCKCTGGLMHFLVDVSSGCTELETWLDTSSQIWSPSASCCTLDLRAGFLQSLSPPACVALWLSQFFFSTSLYTIVTHAHFWCCRLYTLNIYGYQFLLFSYSSFLLSCFLSFMSFKLKQTGMHPEKVVS